MAVVTTVVAVTLAAGATKVEAQEGSGGMEDAGSALIDIGIDVTEADNALVAGTLDELQANVAGQLAELETAKAAVADADAAVTEADGAVAATEAEIADLTAQSDAVVVEAFITPPGADAIDTLAADSAVDATLRQSVLDMQADSDASVLERLEEARGRLEEEREARQSLATGAEERKTNAETALTNLQAASSQQTEFISLVDERIDRQLSEAASVAELDPEMAEEIEGRAAELTTKLQEVVDAAAFADALEALAEAERLRQEEEANNPPEPIELGPASGSLATVACPAGGSITVDSSLESSLESLLGAASADGVTLCGGGYRSAEEQVALREQNCGTSYYMIYEAPASACSPPTARPGMSQHELGLAIDFTCNGGGIIASRSSPCFEWLEVNAAGYGLYNLPSEPWHFSTDGT